MRGASALLNKDIRPAKMSTPHSGKPLVADMSSSSLSVTLPPAFSGDAAFRYWLEDHEALRSPFPAYMRELLQEHTFCHFMGWMFQQPNPTVLTAEAVSEAFGTIIQTVGQALARTDDDRLTIQAPGLPRVGDTALSRVLAFPNLRTELRGKMPMTFSLQPHRPNEPR